MPRSSHFVPQRSALAMPSLAVRAWLLCLSGPAQFTSVDDSLYAASAELSRDMGLANPSDGTQAACKLEASMRGITALECERVMWRREAVHDPADLASTTVDEGSGEHGA